MAAAPPTALVPAPPLPAPFINIPGVLNLRDAGGLATATGKPNGCVRRGYLYRSADPSAGAAALAALNVGTVFDLRSGPEIEKAGQSCDEELLGGKCNGAAATADGAPAGAAAATADGGLDSGCEVGEAKPPSLDGRSVRRVWCPVFETEDYSPERLAGRYSKYASEGTEGFVAAYTDILSHGGTAFRTILKHIAATSALPNQPAGLLVHCTAGKDRTGCFIALVLSLLGVSDEDIADEYALTAVGLAHLKPMFVERLMNSPAFKEEGAGRAGAERMLSSRKENMLATLGMIREKYGSAEGYIRTVCDLSSDEIESIRQFMTLPEQNL